MPTLAERDGAPWCINCGTRRHTALHQACTVPHCVSYKPSHDPSRTLELRPVHIQQPFCQHCLRHLPLHPRGGVQQGARNFERSSLILAPSKIFPWLYLGSQEATLITHPAQSWPQLFTTVVACMDHPPFGWGHQLGGHHHIVLPLRGLLGSSITHEEYVPLLASFTPVFQALDDARMNGGCVYVHCQHGISRSVGVVAAYLLTRYPTGALFDMLLPFRSAHKTPDDMSDLLDKHLLDVVMEFLMKRREAINPATNFKEALRKLSLLVIEQKKDGVVPADGGIGECSIV